MSSEKKGNFAAKHPAGTQADPQITAALEAKATDGQITCAAAHGIAGELATTPADVGIAMDLMNFRIEKCQLGLFGYKPNKKIVAPAEEVDQQLEAAIRENLADNCISCAACWAIADKAGIKRMAVASICEALKIKISPCQLGAF